jgi:hypothetical protein
MIIGEVVQEFEENTEKHGHPMGSTWPENLKSNSSVSFKKLKK